jgi:hypothetical protein
MIMTYIMTRYLKNVVYGANGARRLANRDDREMF